MKLTVLGNNGPYPAAGEACSGYLFSHNGFNLLVDCGNGVLGNLQKLIGIGNIHAIILTHLHSDHISDMMVLRYAVPILLRKGMINHLIDVYAPADPLEEYNRINAGDAFRLHAVNDDTCLELGGMKITFKEMKHPYKCYGVGIEWEGRRFVFSGDTAWTQNIIQFAQGCDTLMLDAGLLSKDKTNDNVPHLTAAECGKIADEAGTKKLLLTHFWPGYDRNDLLKEAAEVFANVELTEMMKTYEM